MLRPYVDVLRTPGALAFSATGLLARLPMSMWGLGIVLLVSARTGSYGLAGLLAAVGVLAQSAASPAQARLVDHWGQRRVLLPLLTVHTVALVTFLAEIVAGASVWMLSLAAGVAGASLPQFGALVRARWAALHRGTRHLHTAYSLESVLDEVVFIVGPVLVTVLAVQVDPLAGLGSTVVLTLGGGLLFAAQRASEPRPQRREPGVLRAPLPLGTMVWVVAAFAGMGSLFGTIEVATVAFTEEVSTRAAAGPVLAVFAAGSLLAGVVVGAMSLRSTAQRRFVVGQAALTVATVLLLFVGSVPALAGAALLCGLTISPTLIAGFSLVEGTVPPSRLTEGLAWVSTALGAGVALGAAVTGRVVDLAGPSAGFAVAVAGGLVATVAAAAGAVLRPAVPRATTVRA
ncbi:MAG TPA: MFS transporter [Jiangellales bacterium]|nr:MFS transporter [Jiangellales bacterium]